MTSTKQKILTWKKEIDALKEGKFKSILAEEKKISNQVVGLVKRLQNQDYKDSQEFESINQQIESLNKKSKCLKEDYQKIMQNKFAELYQQYSSIFNLLVNSTVDSDVLNHVLDTFDRVENGQKSMNQGLNDGMDFLTDKYKLPNDFFNRTTD